MPDKRTKPDCPKKKYLDDEAKAALDDIGAIRTTDKEIDMNLCAAKEHLNNILQDNHKAK
jgi:hypothetical protein